MKSFSVLTGFLAFASFVSAYSEPLFPFLHRHARRAGDLHKKHADLPVVKRQSQCQFPTGVGLVPVTPDQQNAGWAMSPNQPCLPGNYCPYACPPGQVMAQWDPAATSYTYPLSMHGGLFCSSNGSISKPFPDKPYCVAGVGNFRAVNEASEQVSICQTVLPGNEAMLIANSVGANSQLTLAVPDPSYWCSTAAEYYINIPGYGTDTACVWGDSSKPYGNWAPFVAGANQASDGTTFVMVGINPIFCCEKNAFAGTDPGFAIRIDCPSGNCNGVPCECNPATMGPNRCTGGSVGAGGAQFCIVTVPSRGSANLVIFSTSNGSVTSNYALSNPEPGPVVHVPAAPAPASPPASASDENCTTTTSSSWTTDHTPTAVSPNSETHGPYSSKQTTPSASGSNQNQASLSSDTSTSTTSSSPSSTSSPTSQSSTLVQATSGSERAMHTSTLLCLMCVVAWGMVNL